MKKVLFQEDLEKLWNLMEQKQLDREVDLSLQEDWPTNNKMILDLSNLTYHYGK